MWGMGCWKEEPNNRPHPALISCPQEAWSLFKHFLNTRVLWTLEGRGCWGGNAVAWYPESALWYSINRVRGGLCGLLDWTELGDRDLWAGTVADWVPRNLWEPPGISRLDVGGGQFKFNSLKHTELGCFQARSPTTPLCIWKSYLSQPGSCCIRYVWALVYMNIKSPETRLA